MFRLILIVLVVAFIVWWGYQFNRDLPQRVRKAAGRNRWLKRLRRGGSGRQVQEWATLSALYEENDLYQGLPEEKQQAFERWLKNLDEAEVKALTERAEKFCQATRLDLRWLMNSNAQRDERLAQGLSASVVAYLIAYWEAHEIEDRATAFTIYEKWQSNPSSRRNRPLTQALFDQLSARGAVSPLPAQLALAPHKKRLEHIVAAIERVAERDLDVVYSAIEGIVLEKEKSATARERLTRLRERVRRRPAEQSVADATA